MHCHNCDRRWRGVVYALDDHMRALHALDPHNPCGRCEMLHGEGKICVFLPETCTCDTPHVEIVQPVRSARSGFAQVRAEQRTAVYRMPDGTISVPSSNRYDDEIALAAVAGGGVREEMYHVSDMRRLHRDQRQSPDDDFSDRCLVIDYDQASILAGDTFLRDRLRAEDEHRQKVEGWLDRGEVRFGGDYYEQVKRMNEGR